MTLAKARGVIGGLIDAVHTHGDVLKSAPLKPARRALADRIGIQQQRDHRRRIVRCRRWPSARELAENGARSNCATASMTNDAKWPSGAAHAGTAATTAPAHDRRR
jgi:hypothetical protein